MSKQKAPISKTFHYMLVSNTGNKCIRRYKCKGMVELLENVKHELETYDVEYWKILGVDYNHEEV